jgi:hypothetical protein
MIPSNGNLRAIPGVVDETRVTKRRRTFHASKLGIVGIVTQLAHEKFTGQIVVNMSQGGVQSIVAEDSQKSSS